MLKSIGLNLAVVIAFIKGAELLLRAHQRNKVQAFLEDITLRLATYDFKNIAKEMAKPEAQFCFILLAYTEITVVGLGAFILQEASWRDGGMLNGAFGQVGRYIQAGALVLGFLTLGLCWKWPIPFLMKLVVGRANNRASVFIRYFVLVMTGVLAFGAYQLILILIMDSLGFYVYDPKWPPIFFIGLLPVWPIFVIYWVIIQAVGALLQARTFLARWGIAIIKGLLWEDCRV